MWAFVSAARAERCICYSVGLPWHLKYCVQCESCPSHFLLSYVKLIFVWCCWSSQMPVSCNCVNLLHKYLWLSGSGMWNGNRRARITLFMMFSQIHSWCTARALWIVPVGCPACSRLRYRCVQHRQSWQVLCLHLQDSICLRSLKDVGL